MKTLGAVLPPVSAGSPINGASWGNRGLTVLLARNTDAKARILSSWQQGLSTPLRPNGPNGAPATHTQALIIDAQDLSAAAGFADAELCAGLAAAGSPERSARQAIAALRARAATLLADDGSGGRIAHLTEHLRGLEQQIGTALAAEDAERARIAPLLAAAAVIVDLERERAHVLAERERWSLVLRLWPEWQRLEQARRDLEGLAQFERLPGDIEERLATLEQREERAERTLGSARRVMNRLASERDELKDSEILSPGAAEDAERLCAELPVYRSRLLELAAARARLADCDRALAAALTRVGRSEDAAPLAEVDLTPARRNELQRWQERSRRAQAAHTDANSALGATRTRVRDLCTQVSEQFASTPAEGEDEGDARWRSLWRLRSQLEDIWDVQSRAESNARALAEREDAVRRDGGGRHWMPPRWLLGPLTGCAVAATAAWGSGALRGRVPSIALAGLAAMLILLRLLLQARVRWVQVVEQHRGDRGDRLRRDIETLRRRRDAGWTRAAKLNEAIRTAAAALALPEPVTPEAVESCEQELAAQLRTDGARTHLTSLLLELLDAQDDEHRIGTQIVAAEAERRALAREWEAWRKDAGFPHEIAIERIEGWLEELDQLASARSAFATARGELQAVEPVTAAWEVDARHLLQQAGIEIRSELCGSALAGELNGLAARAQRDADRWARRARVDAELPEAERNLSEAEAEAARVRTARQELLSVTGSANAAALRAQVDGMRRWREARDRVRRLQTSIDDALDGLLFAADVRAALASGESARWDMELQRSNTRLAEVHSRLDGAAQRRLDAEQCLEEARAATLVCDLRLEREDVIAELTEAAREWKLRVLAAALLEASVQEHEGAGRRELLEAASRTLAALTRGRYTGIARSEQPAGLWLVDREGHRVPVGADLSEAVRGHLHLSLLLGRAAQLASRGNPLPFVLDDVLGPLPHDDAHLVAQEIASLARAHPVFYLATAARRVHILSAMPSDVAVVDVE